MSWNTDFYGSPTFALYKKLKVLQLDLKAFNKENYSDITKKANKA